MVCFRSRRCRARYVTARCDAGPAGYWDGVEGGRDVARHEVIETVELERGEGKPVGVVASADGARVYVANGLTSAVSVIDARTLRVVARIPVGRRPWGIALSADGRWLYTANGLSNDISIIDTRTHRVIRVGQRPWGIAVR